MDFNYDELIVYTALIGDNEGLNNQPHIKSSKLRHVCLTDNKDLKSNDWEIIQVERIIPQDTYRSQRNFKIRPHIFFPEYKYSLYFDNTIVLKRKIEDFIHFVLSENNIQRDDPFFCLPFHSQFNLINEFNACANNKLDSQIRIYEQLNDYLKTDISKLKNKAFWGGILLRNHNHPDLIKISEIWFAHICRYSRRDQLSIMHSAEQAKFNLTGFNLNNSNSDYHRWPVAIKTRRNRIYDNNLIDLIPYNKLLKLSDQNKEDEFRKKDLKNIEKKLSIKDRFQDYFMFRKFRNFLKKINLKFK